MPRLTRKAVVQAELETTYGVAPVIDGADALLVTSPDFNPKLDMLKRDFSTPTLSPQPGIMGRVLAGMKFSTELRSNGKSFTGAIADAPRIARLFQACGLKLSSRPAANASTVYPINGFGNATFTADESTLSGLTTVIAYKLAVFTGGPSGTAQLGVLSPLLGEGKAPAVITSGTPITIGTKGLKVTITWAGDLQLGDTAMVYICPPGLKLEPISDLDQQSSLTINMNKDGQLHQLTGAMGTFSIKGESAKIVTVDWEFTGYYNPMQEVALPNVSYEKTLPAMLEKANLQIDAYAPVVKTFSFDVKNDVQVREDINQAMGFAGLRITNRAPEGGLDPEADRLANHDFWSRLTTAATMGWSLVVGKKVGNMIALCAPQAQYTGLTYRDRNGFMTYDAGLMLSGVYGDDEFFLYMH